MALNRVDAVDDRTHNRRRVTGAGADLQHPVAGLQLGRLDHQRDNVGLRDRLAFADGQRPIFVSELFKIGLDKGFTRNMAHGIEHVPVAHSTPGDLNIDHPVSIPRASDIQHGTTRSIIHSGCALRPDAKSRATRRQPLCCQG